jgi:hypothetical protein
VGVCECAFERVTINSSWYGNTIRLPVRMFHLGVAVSAMNLDEAETLQYSQYLPAGEQRFRSLLLPVF